MERALSNDERLWIKAILSYYTEVHFNKRVTTLLQHILNVGKLDDKLKPSEFRKAYFNEADYQTPGSSDWLNMRRNSIINKYKDADKLKEIYKELK